MTGWDIFLLIYTTIVTLILLAIDNRRVREIVRLETEIYFLKNQLVEVDRKANLAHEDINMLEKKLKVGF